MRVYLFSLGAGLLVGIIYSLLNVRSLAPPWWRWWGSSATVGRWAYALAQLSRLSKR